MCYTIAMKSKGKNTKKEFDTKEAARALEVLLAAGYVDKKKLYIANFIRGISVYGIFYPGDWIFIFYSLGPSYVYVGSQSFYL